MRPEWHSLFVNLVQFGASDLPISILEKVIRPVAVYLLLVAALRAFGKRILAQLNPFDLVVLLTLSNTVQNAIIGNDTSLTGGILGAAALLAVNALLVRMFYRGPGMEHRMMQEHDISLIRDSRVQEETLRKLRINLGELTATAHERGFDDLHEVETAVLYPNGTIYMKGTSEEAASLREVLRHIEELRRDIAAMRAGR